MKKKNTTKKLQKYQNGGTNTPLYTNPFSGFMGNANLATTGTPSLNLSSIFGGSELYSNVMQTGQDILGSGITSPKNLTYEEFLKEYGYNDEFLSKSKYQAYKNAESTVNTNNQAALVKNSPLIANVTAIDELNKMTEKSYNQGLKLDAQDLTKGNKGQEFRGFFAQDGMRVGSGGRNYGGYPNFNQRVSPQDSVRNMAYNTMTYEENAGGEWSNPLSNFGNRALPSGTSKQGAVDWYMKNTLPLVQGKYQTAMETAAAGDFAYNAGKDARVYMLDQYIKMYKKDPKGLPGRGAFNVDIKTDKWKKEKGLEFEQIWNKYKDEIESLPEQKRRELINNGRDYYYTHIDLEADGSPNHAYKNSWFGRQHASDQYEDIREGVTNPEHPKYYEKYHPSRVPKKQDGGPTEYPFLDLFSSSRDDDKIKKLIKKNEGSITDSSGNHIMYPDSEGYSTVGYGHLMRGVESPILSQKSADELFDRDYEIHKKHAEKIPGFSRLDSDQKAALIDMTFNMGTDWYKKFPKFTKALEVGDLNRATSELRDSLWAKQVGPRAERNIEMIGGNRMSSLINREKGGSISALHRSMGADIGLPMQKMQSGGKPKKRIILAERPKEVIRNYNFADKDENYPLGTFDSSMMMEGRSDLANKLIALEKKLNLGDPGRDDGSRFADDVFDAVNNSLPISETAKKIKEKYGFDLLSDEDIVRSYKKSTGYPGIVTNGYEKYNLIENVEENQDDTFVKEAEKVARLSEENGVPAEIIPIYGKDEFNKLKERFSKDNMKGADVVILGHSSDKQMFGIPNKEINSYLKENMDPNSICYGGTCYGTTVAASMPDVPNMMTNINRPWIGVPDYKSYKGRDFDKTFFGNQPAAFDGENDNLDRATAVSAKYGRDYVKFDENTPRRSRINEPERLSDSRDSVRLSRIRPLRTMQHGGSIQKFQNSGEINNLLSSIGVSQVQSSKPSIADLSPTDKLGYFKTLSSYVKQNGIESLREYPQEYAFFMKTADDLKTINSDPKKESPKEGGTYVSPEIKDKRKKEKTPNPPTIPTVTERLRPNFQIQTDEFSNPYEIALEYLTSNNQDSQMSKDDYREILMQVEEEKRRQNPNSNIYTSTRTPYSPSISGQSDLIRSIGRGMNGSVPMAQDGLNTGYDASKDYEQRISKSDLAKDSGIKYSNLYNWGKISMSPDYVITTMDENGNIIEKRDISKIPQKYKDKIKEHINSAKLIDGQLALESKDQDGGWENPSIKASGRLGLNREDRLYLGQALGMKEFMVPEDYIMTIPNPSSKGQVRYVNKFTGDPVDIESDNSLYDRRSITGVAPLTVRKLYPEKERAIGDIEDWSRLNPTYEDVTYDRVNDIPWEEFIKTDKFKKSNKPGYFKNIPEYLKNYKQGGPTNQLQQMMGYKDNSPYRSLPFQTINSNSITMGREGTADAVSQPLLAIADTGEVRMLPPNSGLHNFAGANSVTEYPMGSFEEGGIPDRYKEMGFTKVNTPKRTPGADKSHAVVINDDGDYRLIRFGQQGVSGSPAREGESEADKNRRESFRARHAENIAKGKTSAAYWANKVKWEDGGSPSLDGIEMAQNGLRASRQDSIDVMNSAKDFFTYYKNRGYKNKGIDNVFMEDYLSDMEASREDLNNRLKNKVFPFTSRSMKEKLGWGENQPVDKNFKMDDYYQNIDKNKFKQRDLVNKTVDLRSPMPLFDRRITPQTRTSYVNENRSDKLAGDHVSTYTYDPIAVTPVDMLTPLELIARRHKYPDSFSTSKPASSKRSSRMESIKKRIDSPIIEPRQPRPNININQIDTINPQAFSQPQRMIDTPEVEDSNFNSGELVKPFEGVPNLNVVFKERKSDGELIPVFIENQAGERVPYNSQLNRDFQYKKKNGGKITSPINLSNSINPFRLSPANSYGVGGLIREGSPSKPKSYNSQAVSGATTKGPMGSKDTDMPAYSGGIRRLMDLPENEYIATENLIPVQTERGEMIVHPTGDLSKVMAKKRHYQMDEDEVTDVAPEGAYILSSFGKVRINKDEAEQIITETGVKPYRIGGIQDSPTEKNLASMMNKKSMAPADVAKKVDRFFPVNATNNPFELAANNENKIHRVPYLEGLIQLSELDKLRKGIDTSSPEATREYRDESDMIEQQFKNGGSTWGGSPMLRDNIPHAVAPLLLAAIPAIGGLLQAGIGALGAGAQRRDAKKAYQDVLGIANTSATDQKSQVGAGTLAGILGTLNQNPVVKANYTDPTYLQQMRTQTPSSTLEAISNRSFANMPDYMRNAPSWQAGLGSQQAAYAAALKMANDARLAIGDKDTTTYNNWLGLMHNNLAQNDASRTAAEAATTLNRNQQLGNVGDRTQGMFDSYATIEANRANTASAARLGQSAANQQAIRAFTQAGQSVVGTAGAAAYDAFSKPNTTPMNPYTGQPTTGNPVGYNPYSTPTPTAVGSTTPAQGDCERKCRDLFTGQWVCC